MVPEKIYKYAHADRIDVIKTRSIRFTPPGALNDPFELFPVVTGVMSNGTDFMTDMVMDQFQLEPDTVLRNAEAEIQKNLPPGIDASVFRDLLKAQIANFDASQLRAMIEPFMTGMNEAAASQGWDGIRDRFDSQVGILSLSSDPTNLLMWSHYADSHRGLVLEFDGRHPFFDQRLDPHDPIRHLRPVVYQRDRPTINYVDPDADMREYFLSICATVFLTKGTDWRYETEWRMMLPLAKANASPASGIHLFSFPADALTGIIVGAKATASLTDELLGFRELPEWRHLALSRAGISRSQFAVELQAFETTGRGV